MASPRRSISGSPALSEGEVLSGDEEKAISTQTNHHDDGKVNTSTRPHHGSSSRMPRTGLQQPGQFRSGNVRNPVTVARVRSRSPYQKGKSRSRSRSPYRADRAAGSGSGEKRRRDDDHYGPKAGSDPRRFKVHYEEGPDSRGGFAPGSGRSLLNSSRNETQRAIPSHTNQASRSRGTFLRKTDRDRSRSPFRHDKAGHVSNGHNACDSNEEGHTHEGSHVLVREQRRGSIPSLTERESALHSSQGKDDAKIELSLPQQAKPLLATHAQASRGPPQSAARSAGNHDDSQKTLSEAEIIEQRRRRREAIKNKHRSQPELLVQALEKTVPSAPNTPAHDSSSAMSEHQSPPSVLDSPQTPRTPARDSPPDSPAAFAVADDEELANRQQADTAVAEDEGPSAADYDPNMDMQEDRPDFKRPAVDAPAQQADSAKTAPTEPQAATKASKEFDMFADDDDDDMFAPADTISRPAMMAKQAKTLDQSLLDNWDYPDGHYRIIQGELLDDRYAVQQQIGKGTFATVVSAEDTKTGLTVAIKIAANNETMYKAGQKEMDFLKLLNDADPEDKKHVIRLLRSFDFKGHMCIVFEALSADLRWVLKKFGRNVGLNLKAIRSYAQQMFLSLSHMKKCSILHADLKPDNILVSEKRNLLKVCDLGTAAFVTDTEITPYLVSRFYRAPEVILGMPFGYAIDMWSIGCTLFELYTGRILFPGADNNQMLRVIQECRGKIPIRMLKQANMDQRSKHFDDNANFFSLERDKVTGKTSMRQLNFRANGEPGKDVKARLAGNAKDLGAAEIKEHMAFVDLLEKCLQLDPARRITPGDALRHGFVAHHGQEGAKEARKVVPAMGVGVGMPRVR
ncbi:hypothetical protein BAUCODRAFT_96348 [Baudoinia panamericana UAMH 10762]|uniref:non-specific serine/threonine protein kinase n=1 Tax=Baudoinia panamericana (strain UAMH 10762) TaxID=717646 RepID=M2MNB2_BAUPA|nr:uncharacterized protein BAUCODRAFT_96348 [Baudoinia panamericana UAMH 10762]EMC92933.1 hypothetical protein BAUCODRAFT_96348 [Baudoinia panamericana UAMH 10762]